MNEYIYSVILANDRGGVANTFGVAVAHSEHEAAALGLDLSRRRHPEHPQIVVFGAIRLDDAQRSPVRVEVFNDYDPRYPLEVDSSRKESQ